MVLLPILMCIVATFNTDVINLQIRSGITGDTKSIPITPGMTIDDIKHHLETNIEGGLRDKRVILLEDGNILVDTVDWESCGSLSYLKREIFDIQPEQVQNPLRRVWLVESLVQEPNYYAVTYRHIPPFLRPKKK